MMRRTPLRRISSKRTAQLRERRHISALVQAREGSHCARCGVHAPIGFGAPHHRRKQSQATDDSACNIVWLCSSCNCGYVEDNPIEATRLGWTVPHGVTPQEWPVWRTQYGVEGWWLPTAFGWEQAQPHERQRSAA